MAKQVSLLPAVADAHRNGDISNGQLGAVAAIASASSEAEALALAKTATSTQLARQAATSRGKLFEQRKRAEKSRYLAFKAEEDGQSIRLHGRLGFEDGRQLEMQLRKIADRLGQSEKERPSPSTRMADALLILTKHNPSVAFHAHKEQAGETSPNATQEHVGSTPGTSSQSSFATKTKLHVAGSPSKATTAVVDYDEDPFPEPAPEDRDRWKATESSPDHATHTGSGVKDHQHEPEPFNTMHTDQPVVIVQRADTRLIIHWNAATGSINFENGPPVDHPRLRAILCDAQIDIQHCDSNGLPTGLVTTAHHANYRQERYLAYRDGVCRIPECEGIGKTQAHHIFEDRIDRITSVEYMINLCNRHHTEHHDGIFTITGKPETTITFACKDGTILTSTATPTVGFKPPKPTPFKKHPDPCPCLTAQEFPMSA